MVHFTVIPVIAFERICQSLQWIVCMAVSIFPDELAAILTTHYFNNISNVNESVSECILYENRRCILAVAEMAGLTAPSCLLNVISPLENELMLYHNYLFLKILLSSFISEKFKNQIITKLAIDGYIRKFEREQQEREEQLLIPTELKPIIQQYYGTCCT